jgi:transcriptional regulator of arginine metabolism
MSKLNLNNVSGRRDLVINLVDEGLIHSQGDLVKELAKKGYRVTQATAS